MKASWLFSRHPIVVDTDLATVVGLNEAIVLQQVNYWLHTKSGKIIDGRRWVYNTYENWQKTSFPFWSSRTVKRIFTKLENKGLLITGNFNKAGFDKTKWYSIDDDKLNQLMVRASGQNGTTSGTSCPDGEGQNGTMDGDNLDRPIPETTRDYTKTTTEKINSSPDKQDEPPIPYKEIVEYLNKKIGTHYKPTSRATQKLIKARWHEGYKLDDFKQVINNKAFDWQGDSKMQRYLRPATLFGTKFEDYLNENKVKKDANDDGHGGYGDLLATDDIINSVNEDDLPF